VNLALFEEKKFIGNGRSAKVYLSYVGGKGIATKTFTGEPVSKLILFVLTGSANPYTWCEDAINSAIIRRRLLSGLVQFWFKDKMRLPKTYGYRWNPEHKAFEIDAEFITGQHAPLLTPLEQKPKSFMSELRSEIMNPLQDKLIDSGFDGLVWQAGKGNPVGASNFMLLRHEDGTHEWIWIDLESGLPALFALNIFSTLFYYLPKCVKHRDWLFDNVDTAKLKKYLEHNKEEIILELGLKTYHQLCTDSDLLSETQKKWKNIKRYKRSLYYAASQDKITEEEKEYYEDKPVRWYLKSFILFFKAFILKVKDSFKSIFEAFYNFRYKKLFRRIYLYFSDSRYRWGVARWYLKKEIDKWQSRKFLTNEESTFFKNELKKDETSAYMTDFSIHIGIKPFVKLFAWVIMPLLIATGMFSLQAGAIIIIGAGSIARTLYTLWRITHNLVKSNSSFPLIALIVGVFPVIGNLAYPMEILYRSTGKKGMLAKFIVYSFSAKIGAKVPIWGGKDSETEHFFNKICHKVLNF
jgi:hypothetical protein